MTDRRATAIRASSAMVALVGMLSSCSADGAVGVVGDGDVRPATEMHFLRPALGAPQLSNPTVSFYARRGQDREVFMYYRPRPGTSDSTLFMRFKVPGASLARRPDGTAFAMDDSVLITIRVADPSRLILDFEPSGLRFSESTPAELKIDFQEASDDLDGDGDVDAEDDAHERELSIWRQEAPGLPWTRLSSFVDLTSEKVEAKLVGFTGYAISY